MQLFPYLSPFVLSFINLFWFVLIFGEELHITSLNIVLLESLL